MRRGDIWLFDLEPVRGAEASQVRPVVIVSNDGANQAALRSGMGVVTAVPLTTNTQRVMSFQVLLDPGVTGLRVPSKAQTEQVRAMSVARAVRHVGRVPVSTMDSLDEALRRHLAL